MWRLWCLALGNKASSCDKESDQVAIIRTVVFATYLVTNIAIVANAVRHWNDGNTNGRAIRLATEPVLKTVEVLKPLPVRLRHLPFTNITRLQIFLICVFVSTHVFVSTQT